MLADPFRENSNSIEDVYYHLKEDSWEFIYLRFIPIKSRTQLRLRWSIRSSISNGNWRKTHLMFSSKA